ncbi:FG-GAP-like repeat-containing protein [Hymenobacter sp. DH14]|uniref:FG-GAP-like repeat-containing protein n=1 Tax=Hymenobacter cyanobacteriorum TaxID=2926463 RepID=A0A9X1VGZ5_9BACT|nr:FG-GAP-like repeat-containing protein [Hymenobacter cyanobacteriorum]MCI1188057.1 FG-GAP-like repeat-containing protein [Hymenobacter cyanobacteriorum]
MASFSTSTAAHCGGAGFLATSRASRWHRLLALGGLLPGLAAQAQVTVMSRQPARHAVAAPRSSAVGVGFSQAISAASAGNLRVYSAQRGGRLAGSLSGGGTAALSFAPGQAFMPGDVLSVSLPASMLSTGGTALARQVYQFTAATGGGGKGFFGDTTVVGNTGNRDQVLGDLDNDGDLDLVTTGALYGCRIFLNNGNGRFTFKTGVVTAQTPSGVTLADVNQDGYLDMLVGDADNAVVSVCINDGTGDFIGSVTGAQNAPVGLRPVSVAAGDVDGDGDLDFVTANNGGNSATVRYNNGALPLLYTAATTVGVGVGPTAVALADVDNDGDLDLLTSNAGTLNSPIGTVSLCRNSGTGTFGAPTTFAVGLQPSELALADVDGDGDLDLLTANTGGASVSRLLNNGSGTFASLATTSLPAGSTPTGLRTGDLDADGDLDLLVAQGSGGRVFTCLNAAGSFAVQARPLRLNRPGTASPVQAVGVALGDLDGDGDLDLITSDEHGKVLASLNQGSLAPLPAPVITGLSPVSGPVGATVTITGTALTDVAGVFFNGLLASGFVLNGTGTGLDVVVPAGATSGVVTVVTEEAGTATSPTPFTIVVPVPVLLTAIAPARNAVAVPRASTVAATFTVPITAATAGNLRVFGSLRRGGRPGAVSGGGTSTLTFAPSQEFAPGELVSVSLPGSLQAADGNRVNKQVVQFTAAVGGTGRHYFVGTGTLATAGATGFRAGDFDNDGDVDLVAPGGAQGLLLLLNDGTGTFASATPLAGTAPASGVVVGDVDGDGDLDLVSSATATTGKTWLNNGSGAFAGGSSFSGAIGASTLLALADADADGDLDLLFVGDGQITTLLNNGAGTFASQVFSASSVTATAMTIGDVDGDGDLDVVVAGRDNYGYERLTVSLNNGAGSFATAAALTQSANTVRKMVLGDLDGDGDLDLALQSYPAYSYRVVVLRNNGAGNFSQTAILGLGGNSLAVGDTDADGDLDLVTSAGVALNDGAGQFTLELTPTSTTDSNNVVLADLDGDLDLDELCEDNSNTVLVKLNRPGPPPTLAGLRPAAGPVGSAVLLTGTNLQTTASVSFNGVATAVFTVLSNTQLVATVPAGATSGPVAATTPAGTATAPGSFAVLQTLAATQVSPARNTANAPRPSTVSVTFARPVSAASAGELRVFSNRRSGTAAGTATASGSTVALAPARPLAAGERLSVSVPDRLAGTDGSRAERQVFEFTMAAGGTGTGLFLPVSNGRPFAAYRSPAGFAVGDLDRDGDLDVLSNSGIVRFNDGEGAFPDSTMLSYGYFAGTASRHVVVGDLNGDGYFDLLSTSGTEYLNNQQGGFTNQASLRGFDDDTRDLALGDLDADGDLDLVAPNYARDSVRVLFNDGTGHFPTRLLVAVGSRPTGISLGDVDNDGDLDFITANAGVSGSSLSVALNNGIGVFTSVQTTAAGTGLLQAVLGDLDGDHDLDLVTSNGLVRFNNGTGTFAGSQTTATGTDLALGDLDGDGDLDLLVSGPTTAAVRRNDGTGQFGGTESLSFGSSGQAHHPVLGDLDGDGDLDLLVGDASNATVRVWLNQRLAAPALLSFAPASGLPGATVVVTGTDLVGTTAVSFNGTAATSFSLRTAGRLEVQVPAGATTGPLQLTNANGTATSATAFTVLQPIAVLNTNPVANATVPPTTPVAVGFGQAIATNTNANLTVFSQQRGGRLAGARTGAGSATLTLTPGTPYVPGEVLSASVPAYTAATARVQKRVFQFRAAVGGTGRGYLSVPTATQGYARQTVLADADGDGDQDVFQVSDNNDRISWQRNNGTGTFGAETPLITNSGNILNLLAVGDVDGDGDLDLAVTNSTANVVHVRLNNGTGVFTAAPDVPVGDYPQGIVLADFDGDGDQDLLTANSGTTATTTSLRYNDGGGHFSGTTNEVLRPSGYAGMWPPKVGDVDGDGDLDLVMANLGTSSVRLNDGEGHFSPGGNLPFYLDVDRIIELADVDGDGDLDVLGTSFRDTGGNVSGGGNVWVNIARNDGTGSFTAGGFWASRDAECLALGDLDADGDLDLVTSSPNFYTGQVLLNNGTGTFTPVQDFAVSDKPRRPALADVDGDGDLDFVTTYPYLTVFYNGPLPLPVITSFTPTSGAVGTPVVITGTAFAGTTAVRFNGTNAPGFVINSNTRITVNVPTGATTGAISITTPNGTGTSATAFAVAPQVVATQLLPAANAPSVARNAAVGVTFPAAITAASAGTMRVFGSQLRGKRPGTLSGGGTAALSFDPSQDFAPGEQISVSLPRSMQTTTGALVSPQVYQFTAATGGTGRGGFVPGPLVAMGQYAAGLAMGDLDNDGDLDMITALETGLSYSPARVGVRLNNGQGQFSAGTNITTSIYGIEKLALGDVDSDGDLDVIVGAGSRGVNVCLNNGSATFGAGRFVGLIATQLAVGDMDGDGDLDIVVGDNSTTGLVTIAVNDGQANFTYTSPNLSYYYPITDLALGDIDGDGDLDAVTANDHNGVRLLLNTGTNVLTVGATLPVTDYVPSLALADLDNDGDLDLAIGLIDAANNSAMTTMTNNGTGGFTGAPPQVTMDKGLRQLALGDVDHDGDLDVVALSYYDVYTYPSVNVRLNNGAGRFARTASLMLTGSPSRLALGDLDGDGDLDCTLVQFNGVNAYLDERLNDGVALATTAAQPTEAGVRVYPNPAHGRFTLLVPHELRSATPGPLRLYNALGQLVLEQPYAPAANGEQTVEAAHLPPGLYTLRLALRDGPATFKIVLH